MSRSRVCKKKPSISSIKDCECGSSGLELALLAPVILGLCFVLIDLGRLFITDSLLRSSLALLSTSLRYEAMPNDMDSLKVQLIQLTEQKAAGWIDPDALELSVTLVPGLGRHTYSYDLSYRFKTQTPFAPLFLGDAALTRSLVHQDDVFLNGMAS
ncbi:MAG: TadE family protein [Sneathiella sp.]